MPKSPVIKSDESYTFADYFKLNFAPQDILAYFDVSLQRKSLKLPEYTGELDRLEDLKNRIEESLPRLSLTSEMARREFLIAPVLTDVMHYTEATLNVEYPVAVNNQLKGSLDYLLQNKQTLLVIEAKNEDLERGFLQLAIELIALEQWFESEQTILQGAVLTGNIWQFGQFNRQSRTVTQDLDLYRVPADLNHLLRVLVEAINYGS
ncbi:hypothetical protein PN466_21275 [Roseofilum reptotaenium CS-1145]|uniref:Type I restriction enzyme R protein N-terminal domain-containing protein n=1 Tax=Roseofilum reptotaenium AO1-A TaxID=1925591 RepID=A0A1L9QT17_9CYAN|nr:hypothetical protein [Roseofilum reptotaenium]MDB9519480.1 hypothetical protein [Roseofilum reptotaenium CS-1145]OJJ25737.1 hypothetical protein BI308_09440 [Roseofilum reptotaenium AO1-A]